MSSDTSSGRVPLHARRSTVLDGKQLTAAEKHLKAQVLKRMRLYHASDEKVHKDAHPTKGHRKELGVDFARVTGMVQRDMVRLYRDGNAALYCYACGAKCRGVDAHFNAKEKKDGNVFWRKWTLDRIANKYGHTPENMAVCCLHCNIVRQARMSARSIFLRKNRSNVVTAAAVPLAATFTVRSKVRAVRAARAKAKRA
jgi:hypothetical protein